MKFYGFQLSKNRQHLLWSKIDLISAKIGLNKKKTWKFCTQISFNNSTSVEWWYIFYSFNFGPVYLSDLHYLSFKKLERWSTNMPHKFYVKNLKKFSHNQFSIFLSYRSTHNFQIWQHLMEQRCISFQIVKLGSRPYPGKP